MFESRYPTPFRVYIVDPDEEDLYDFIIEAKSIELANKAADAMYEGHELEFISGVIPVVKR